MNDAAVTEAWLGRRFVSFTPAGVFLYIKKTQMCICTCMLKEANTFPCPQNYNLLENRDSLPFVIIKQSFLGSKTILSRYFGWPTNSAQQFPYTHLLTTAYFFTLLSQQGTREGAWGEGIKRSIYYFESRQWVLCFVLFV